MSENQSQSQNVLDVRDLKVEFQTYGGVVQAVRGVNLSVDKGQTLAIVGESGSGKSVTIQSVLGLIPTPPGRITSGSAKLCGKDLMGIPLHELNKIRGKDVGVIFQDSMSSLNPTMTIGDQISESLTIHMGMSRHQAKERAIELLAKVKIPEPATRVNNFPFEFSGGMRQRAMIAMAIACNPQLLIADEPTTALDVTIQSQILELLRELQRSHNMALILITHDLGVVARMADHVAVMYAGKIVEKGTADQVFYNCSHPYTMGLRSALPTRSKDRKKLVPIEGSPPDLFMPPKGCGYYSRCPFAMKVCEHNQPPDYQNGAHVSACWLQHEERKKLLKTENIGIQGL